MKHILSLALFVLACGGGGDADATPPGLRVNPSSIPAGITGRSTLDIRNTAVAPGFGGGEFRTFCDPSHYGYDDPIVNQTPGTPNLSHLHLFWGSVDTNYNTDILVSPQTTAANSSCRAGIGNRSRYWAPAMVNTKTGKIVQPIGIHVYYKRSRITSGANINVIPTGLRMIRGDSTSAVAQDGSVATFTCFQAGTGTGSDSSNLVHAALTNPYCVNGTEMWQTVLFGQCLSTTLSVPDVDSVDHKSHATRDVPGGVCPGTHPYGIPGLSINIIYLVTSDLRYWRLSSDVYTGPGGYSSHSDFRMGWDTNLHGSWVNGCVKRDVDCASHLLGCFDHNNNPIACREMY